jgi:hypothetical protein
MVFQQYLLDAERQYHLRIKAVVPIDDAAMDRIEQALMKYDPVSISKPYKTILQRAPLDFPQIQAAEVVIIDVVLGLPAAAHVVREDLRRLLNAPEDYIVVRNKDEPGEIETDRLNALADIDLEAAKKGLRAASLLADLAYDDADTATAQLYGNAYNSAFLSHLRQIEQERSDRTYKVANAPFKWLGVADTDITSGPEIAGAPIAARSIKRTEPVLRGLENADRRREVRKVFVDAKGERVVLTRNLANGE